MIRSIDKFRPRFLRTVTSRASRSRVTKTAGRAVAHKGRPNGKEETMEGVGFPFRDFRLTVTTAGPVEALAESLAQLTGGATVLPAEVYWHTGLEQLGVSTQRGSKVETIADPDRLLTAVDRVSEWASRERVPIVLIEVHPTFGALIGND